MARRCDCAQIQNGQGSRNRACVRNLFRFHDYGKRYGAHHLFAVGLSRTGILRAKKISCFCFCNAKRRRKPRRNAHSLRQSSESVPVFLLFLFGGRVFSRYGCALCRCFYTHFGVLSVCQAVENRGCFRRRCRLRRCSRLLRIPYCLQCRCS